MTTLCTGWCIIVDKLLCTRPILGWEKIYFRTREGFFLGKKYSERKLFHPSHVLYTICRHPPSTTQIDFKVIFKLGGLEKNLGYVHARIALGHVHGVCIDLIDACTDIWLVGRGDVWAKHTRQINVTDFSGTTLEFPTTSQKRSSVDGISHMILLFSYCLLLSLNLWVGNCKV